MRKKNYFPIFIFSNRRNYADSENIIFSEFGAKNFFTWNFKKSIAKIYRKWFRFVRLPWWFHYEQRIWYMRYWSEQNNTIWRMVWKRALEWDKNRFSLIVADFFVLWAECSLSVWRCMGMHVLVAYSFVSFAILFVLVWSRIAIVLTTQHRRICLLNKLKVGWDSSTQLNDSLEALLIISYKKRIDFFCCEIWKCQWNSFFLSI